MEQQVMVVDTYEREGVQRATVHGAGEFQPVLTLRPRLAGFTGIDELAARLGVAPVSAHESGIVVYGVSGQAYDWVALLLAHLDYVERAVR